MIIYRRDPQAANVAQSKNHVSCANCGVQITNIEYNSDICKNCKHPLVKNNSVTIQVASVSASGNAT